MRRTVWGIAKPSVGESRRVQVKSSRLVPAVLVVAIGVLAIGGHVFACGDKLVVVGRGLKANRMSAPRRASILVYADPKGSLPAALEEGHLRKDLERAGHRLRTATSREEFDAALGSGTYDLVLADFKAVPLLEPEANAAASKPTVLPTLFNPSEADLAAASRQYSCVVKSPSDQKDYMIVINEAMADRAKHASPKNK
jgi:hypothetical protein